jgi:hypothetical protein
MKEKKLSSLVLNKKVISKLNQSIIAGGLLGADNTIDDVTGLIVCTNSPNSKTSCKCTNYPTSFPPTAGTNTTTDMPSKRCA